MESDNLGRRERFEKDTFPHVEALWRTALWLTKRWSHAEDLVLKTMVEAYCSWPDATDAIGSKARLFRILVRKFADFGNRRHHLRGFLPENGETVVNSGNGDQHHLEASIDQRELGRLAGISSVSVRGVIARLRPESRLVMILLHREQFSYTDIAYIADLHADSVKSILGRLRRMIPRYLAPHEDSTVTTSPNRSVDQVQVPSFDES